MDRRTFLRGLGLAMGAAALGACSPSQASPRASAAPGEAIVVGAGAAGIAAAQRLIEAGQRVVVLEARDRIGGRIWTSDALGPPIDLGASWIHGTTDNPLTPLARAAGLRFVHTDIDRFGSFDTDGRLLPGVEETPVYDHWLSLLEDVRREGGDGSIADALADRRRDPRWSSPPGLDPGLVARYLDWIAATEIGEDLAADLDRLSVRALDDGTEFEGPWVMLAPGYRALLEPIAAGLDIRLGEVVSRIDTRGPRVQVTTSRATHTADRIVVTVPLGVLQSGDVTFDPELPAATRGAIDRLGMGSFLKAVLRYPERVWPGGMDWLGRVGEASFPEFVDLRAVTGEPIAVGFASGSEARRLEDLDDAAVVEVAHAALGAAVPGIPAPVDALVTRWGRDPFAYGSYSYMAVDATPDDRDALAAPISTTLILAGEAANRAHPSTVHGAWLSGQAAVDRLLDARG